jgi:hypothetical protein
MQHLRRFVHFTADAVSAIFPDDRVAVSPGVALDGMAHIAKPGARTDDLDAPPHGFIGHLHQPPGHRRHFADKIGFAGIGDKSILFQRDVEIHDIAVFQDIRRGRNAVANDMVGRGVQREGIAVLSLARGTRIEFVDDEAIDHVIHLHGRHADQAQLVQVSKYTRQQLARLRHQRDFFRPLGHDETLLTA